MLSAGKCLALTLHRFPNSDARYGDFVVEQLIIAEVDTDNRIAAHIVIDPDDMDAAIAELDARYLAGEAAAHSQTRSVVAATCAAFNRHEIPSTTPDPVYIGSSTARIDRVGRYGRIDRCRVGLTPDARIYIEAVHRLGELGAIGTGVMKGTSPEGFDAEWHMINLFTAEGDRLSRFEVFDHEDLDAALARFDELDRP